MAIFRLFWGNKAVAGGTVHSVSITESVGAADSIAAVATKLAQAIEPIGIGDSVSGGVIASVSASAEGVGVAESSDATVVTGGTVHSVSITESVGVADSAATLIIANATIAEAVGIAASQGATTVIVVQIAETVGIAATQNALVPGAALGAPLLQGIRTLPQGAAANVMVMMVDTTDHITALSGLTLTCELSKDGDAFAGISPSVTEVGNGWYKVALTASHTDTLGDLVLHVTATGADPSDVIAQIDSALTTLTAIKAKTDSLTFTVPGQVDANMESTNAEEIIGDGSESNKFRSHLVP